MRISDWSSDVCSSDLADAALRASEERLRLAQELGGVGSFDWDLATGKAEITESCRHVCGLPPDLVMTRQIFETLVHPDDVHWVRAALDAALERGEALDAAYRIIRPLDQELRWIHTRGGAKIGRAHV